MKQRLLFETKDHIKNWSKTCSTMLENKNNSSIQFMKDCHRYSQGPCNILQNTAYSIFSLFEPQLISCTETENYIHIQPSVYNCSSLVEDVFVTNTQLYNHNKTQITPGGELQNYERLGKCTPQFANKR